MKKLLPLFFIFISIGHVTAQKRVGALAGQITDKQTGEGLPGATIAIKGSSVGEVSDEVGNFFFISVPEGKTIFQVSFLGYAEQEIEVMVEAQAINELNVQLELDATTLGEVLVTSQALGQAGAINQQINSNTIVNVVSKDKIRELPDQNAAETIGRISGIYVQRDAGEGQKVVVRGLAPRFNNVTINGLRIPSTDPNDRSVDLSMISPDMLSGIEVFKAIRPDMDGDAIGGAVNFLIKKAEEGFEGNATAQYGYNSQAKELGQYKGTLNLSNRFLDNKLGVIVTGNYQRANRSSDQLRADYRVIGQDIFRQPLLEPRELTLVDADEVRRRYGGSLTVDYKFNPNHSIAWSNLYGHTDREEIRRRRRYASPVQSHDVRERFIDINLFSTSLQGQHSLFSKAELTWQGSYSRTNQDTPDAIEASFREVSAFDFPGAGITTLVNQPADVLISAARNSIDNTFLQEFSIESDLIIDAASTFQADLKIPYSVSDKIAGNFKVGGKFRDNERSREKERVIGTDNNGEVGDFVRDYPDYFNLLPTRQIALSNFLSGPEATDFLGGDYYIGPGAGNVNGPGINSELTNQFVRQLDQGGYLAKDFFGDIDDYTASEKVYAAYALTELNIGKKLLIVGGLRFERTQTSYKGVFMKFGLNPREEASRVDASLGDSTGTRDYDQWLPMIQAKYKVTNWFDIRAAVTKTLSRPDFTNLIPARRIDNNDKSIDQSNPQLLQTEALNYDIFFSFYNKTGLLTLGGFYKQLQNIDYLRVYNLIDANSIFNSFTITSPENATGTTTIQGIEIDMQANLRFLPAPFNYIVVSANATFLTSSTAYPFTTSSLERSPQRPFPQTSAQIFTSRVSRAPRQANVVSNASLGYEKGGFSGRVSMVYQGNTLAALTQNEETDAFTDSNLRFDMAIKQRITKKLSVYVNWNNITNAPERSFLGSQARPTSEDFYGYTADLGVQYKF
jgi:TonB-dependent receptor